MLHAFEQAKQLTREEVIEKVCLLEIRERGVYNEKLSDYWNSLLQKQSSDHCNIPLVIALNNNDTCRLLLDYIKKEPEKVIEGILIAAYVLDTEQIYLYLPEEEKKLGAQLEEITKSGGIRIIYHDFVDRRQYEEGCFHHIGTMAALAEAFSDEYQPKVLVAVTKDGSICEPEYVAYGTKLSELVSINPEEIKGIEIGDKVYDPSVLDTVIDSSFRLGNGVINILGKNSCMIYEAEKRLETARKMGCGKCTFCREGILQIHEMMKDISKGKGNMEYLSLMTEIAEELPSGSLCSIGQTGASFMLEGLKHYPSEYEDHIKRKKCASNVCTAFTSIYIDPELCTGCEKCMDECPVDCIQGKSGYIHMIDEFECTKCGKCIEACTENAIKQAAGRVPKLPDRLIKCGKFKKH